MRIRPRNFRISSRKQVKDEEAYLIKVSRRDLNDLQSRRETFRVSEMSRLRNSEIAVEMAFGNRPLKQKLEKAANSIYQN